MAAQDPRGVHIRREFVLATMIKKSLTFWNILLNDIAKSAIIAFKL